MTSLTNATGTIADSYVYDSFGNLSLSNGTMVNSLRYTGRDFDSETGLYYYRVRHYDSTIGRFLTEDPWDADPLYEGSNLYSYVENDPLNYTDPLGLYSVAPGVPAPSAALDAMLRCMDHCLQSQLYVTSTTNGKHQDPGHAAGTSVDIRPPAGKLPGDVFCCAGECGSPYGLNEGPGGGSFKYTNGYNYHIQLVPRHRPSPKAPNAIPAGCSTKGCNSHGVPVPSSLSLAPWTMPPF